MQLFKLQPFSFEVLQIIELKNADQNLPNRKAQTGMCLKYWPKDY